MSNYQIGLLLRLIVGISCIVYSIKDVSLLQVISLAVGVFLCDQICNELHLFKGR